MELIVLGLFCGALLLCVLLDLSILYALAGGLLLFLLYGRRKGFSWGELCRTAMEGVLTVKNILITFVLIGMLTALWRDAGTIPVIVCYAAGMIRPAVFLVMTFLLNCLVSVLTGTAFGTAATMGVICAAMGAAMEVDMVLTGGAVLSGVFFGDRCSPASTSALLVSELTHTNIFQNIKAMLRTSAVPFLLTAAIYTVMGLPLGGEGTPPDLNVIFSRGFTLHWAALLPAAVVLVLALFQVNVKAAMGASILTALPISLLLQHTPLSDLPRLLIFGYRAADPELAALLNGGGIVSMLRVAAIVCLSSSYSGIFRKTGMLDRVETLIHRLGERTNSYTAMLLTAAGAGMIACNQTLAIMLTHQLCSGDREDRVQLANDLEDTAVVVSPLVPWSIAGGVPLASVGAPVSAIPLAFFLWLLPLWRWLRSMTKKK